MMAQVCALFPVKILINSKRCDLLETELGVLTAGTADGYEHSHIVMRFRPPGVFREKSTRSAPDSLTGTDTPIPHTGIDFVLLSNWAKNWE
jgi:hypothetical protein